MEREHIEKVLSSYQHLGNLAFTAFRSTSREDAHNYLRWFLLDMPVVPVLLACHALYASISIYKLTRGQQYWLKSLVLTTFAAFGGGTMSAVFSGLPAPLFTKGSNYMMSYLAISWYIVNHWTLMRNILMLRPVSAMLAFGATAAKARSIFSFVDTFVQRFPNATAGAIVLGGLAGSGGSLFVSVDKMVHNRFNIPSELSAPGWGFKSAYMAAGLYYIATDPDFVLRGFSIPIAYVVNRDDARFWLSAALCFHAAAETLYGKHFNPMFWVESILYALTGVKSVPESVEVDDLSDSSVRIDGQKEKNGNGAAWADGTKEGMRRRRRVAG